MKPIQTFLVLLAVGILVFLTMLYFPKDGIVVNDHFTLNFASLDDFENDDGGIKNVEDFLQQYEISIDSTAILDSIARAKLIFRKEMLRIQWPNDDRSSMNPFIKSLNQLKAGKKKKLRIMHYGDSQIEGDRITTFIRNDFQKEFGGYGPGLIPIVEGVPTSVIKQENSDNWTRFTLFGRRDTNVLHNRYAPLGSMGMYTYPLVDSLVLDTAVKKAWIEFSPNGMAKNRAKKFNEVTLYYGYSEGETIISTYINDSLQRFDELDSREGISQLKWNFNSNPNKLRFEFESIKSPELYAFSFEGKSGIVVDNIAMRGSSGTLFKKMDRSQLKKFLSNQNVGLFILQYGGNSVPYIKDEAHAKTYGKWFNAQLAYLKSIKPNATFIVIGPSDMATKIGSKFMTYPHLEEVRDALKNAAFENGAGFWDLYEVMGGRNSMVSWVEADPPLAGADYVHFNYRGSKRVSELFLQALWNDINELNLPKEEKIEKDSTKVD